MRGLTSPEGCPQETETLSQIGSWEIDLISRTAVFSPEMYCLMGRSPELGEPSFEEFLESVHPQDRASIEQAIGKAQKAQEPVILDYRGHPEGGAPRNLRAILHPHRSPEGRTVSLSGTVLNVTALKSREREILRIKRLYRALRGVNQATVRARDRETFFDGVCQSFVEEGGFWAAWIGRIGQATLAYRGRQSLPETLALIEALKEELLPATGSGEIHLCPLATAEPLSLAALAIGRELGGERLVVLASGFGEDELELLEEAGSDIAFALENFEKESARIHADEQLRGERDFSDAVIDSLPGVLYLYDTEGRFLRWNKNFEAVTGYSGEEIAGMHPLDFFAGDEQQLLADRIGEVFEAGESSVEADFLCRDGRRIPFHFTGLKTEVDGHLCLVGVGIDITKRRQALEAQKASQELYRTLFEYAPVGIVLADARSYYLDVNPHFCQLIGYTREEFIGLHASDILVPEEAPQIKEALEVIHGREDHQREWLFRRKDGTTFPAEVLATKMPDGCLMGMIQDISARKEAEIRMQELNESLEQRVQERTEQLAAAKLKAEAADRVKSAFLATMSHELRTPLNSILGFTTILLQGLAGPLNEEQEKQLTMVKRSSRHLLDLINDVLDLSKIEAEQMVVRRELYAPLQSLQNVLKTLQPAIAGKGLELRLELPPDLPEVEGDRRRFEQILLNLLSNAVKFTQAGWVGLQAEASRDSIRVMVSDSGIGIQAEEFPRLFQPFHQVDTGLARQHEGTGLGLPICKRLATLMGGDIHVESEWTVGSRFILELPLRVRALSETFQGS